MSAIYVEITATKGSTPRDVGTAMKVTATQTVGTIGGGALEHLAIAQARQILVGNLQETQRNFALGPNLGQCCGGAVTLNFTREERGTDTQYHPVHPFKTHHIHPQLLWLWGAGHVGRAVVCAAPPQAFNITWIDSAADRFPYRVRPGITTVPTADMPTLAAHAPPDAHHLVFTYSHDIDFALCAALLQRGAASIGLIGSDTKWARFSKRLTALQLDPAPITCPIGDKSLGKAPADIAQGAVRSLLALPQRKVPA